MATLRRAGGTSCPAGTAFYTCDGNHFRGCCAVDPCDLPGCPDGSEPETTAAAKTTRTRMTDSGITHTVPNSSVVTVTRHTIVFTPAPSSSEAEASSSEAPRTEASSPQTEASSSVASATGSSAVPTLSSTAPADTSSPTHGDSDSISAGAIAGIVIGALAGAGLMAIVIFVVLRRRRPRHGQSRSPRFDLTPHKLQSPLYLDDGVADKQQQQQRPSHRQDMASPRSHDTPASGGDPFGPFGGRIDRDPYCAPSGHFEMDGAASGPVELPSEPAAVAEPLYGNQQEMRYQPAPATDPNAVLSSPPTSSGYVAPLGHWDQWRALGNTQEN